MSLRKHFGVVILAGLTVSALLSGCGGSSDNKRIPTTVDVFNQHSVVFRNNSTLTAGYNAFGQLGDGSRDNRAVAQIIPNLGHVMGGAAGATHTLSYNDAGFAFAWGFNSYGQLGNSTIPTSSETSSGDYSDTPKQVDTLTKVSSVAAGAFHSLAVSDGKVYAWGYNGFGQIGDDTLVNKSTPVEVLEGGASFTNAIQVAAGSYHSLALTADGRVFAWGDNDYGQLAQDPVAVPYKTTAVQVNLQGGRAIQIAAAGRYSLALMDDGTVYGWGLNQYGQLGVATNFGTLVANPTPLQMKIPDPSDSTGTAILPVNEIAAGLAHVVARVASDPVTFRGQAWGWGFDEKGQLGDNPLIGDPNNRPNRFTPKPMLTGGDDAQTGSGTPVTEVSRVDAFGNSSLVYRRNTTTGKDEVWGWGENGFGQLGAPTADANGLSFRKVPVRMEGY